MTAINKLRSEFDTLQQIASIRHSIDTNDEFYKAEQDFFDETGPVVQEYITDYYRSLVNSRFRTELEKKWGQQLFQLAELSLKTFSPEIIEDLQKENKLTTEYPSLLLRQKFCSKAKSARCHSSDPFQQSTDRDMRGTRMEARSGSWPRTRRNSIASMMNWLKYVHRSRRNSGSPTMSSSAMRA